jgi:hypothetical protein
MTDDRSPSKRRGRRSVVAAVVLALALSGTWWWWPQGDARFVGRWAYSLDGGKSMLFEYRLNANGTGSLTDPVNRIFFTWRVEDGDLIWGGEGDRPGGRLLHSIALSSLKWTGQTVLFRQHRCRIISVDTDVIQVYQDGAAETQAPTVTLTRIAE